MRALQCSIRQNAIRNRLEEAGFVYLSEGYMECFSGGCYFTVRNNSSVIAWKVGEVQYRRAMPERRISAPYHFQIAAAHGDSPSYKVKAVPEVQSAQKMLRLSVEAWRRHD